MYSIYRVQHHQNLLFSSLPNLSVYYLKKKIIRKRARDTIISVACRQIKTNSSHVNLLISNLFQFYLSLYGHKLPVLCMDISSDSTLIATGSADRNVKIWGMDFGDCHKSIFAHEDSVTGLQFVSRTHYFFTCGKDGKVKQWDGDTYDKIITLQVSLHQQ
jgi:WD40 repeat protein